MCVAYIFDCSHATFNFFLIDTDSTTFVVVSLNSELIFRLHSNDDTQLNFDAWWITFLNVRWLTTQ